MAVKRKYRLNLRNYGNLPAIMLSQYDEGYALEFEIRDGTDAASDLSAYTVTLKGTRADTLAYSFAGTISTNVLTFVIDTTMTACAGRGTAEIAIKDTANDVLFATFNMPVFVERAAVPEGSIDADVERAQEIAEQVQEIVDNAAAAVSGEAEKWATGQIDGTDVPSTDPTYENNAKYYAEQAADSAASIGIDATLTQAGKAADAKKTGDEISALKENFNKKIDKPASGSVGQVLTKTADGAEWGDAPSSLGTDQIQSLWGVIKRIGAFTNANGLTAVNAFKEAWGVYDVIDITGVTVSGNVDFFEVGETRQLTASISPTVTAPDQYEEHTLALSSSNTSVATVDSTGLVTAISAGSATITATVTADSGIYTASIDITVIADQTPLYTLPQGTGSYSDNKTSMTIDGNRVSFSMNNTWTTNAKLRIERIPDGTYSWATPTANPNMLFSLAQGDSVTVKLYNIVFPNDAHNRAFIFDLIGSDNKNIHGAGRNIIYSTTRPDGMVFGTKTISSAKDIYGISNEVGLDAKNGTYAFNFKMFVNGIRYY